MFKTGKVFKYFLCVGLVALFGAVEGLGCRLTVSQDGFACSADQSQNDVDATASSATLSTAVPWVSAPGAILADINRLTASDLVIDYKILGDLSQVASAVVEIRDDLGELVFTQAVPVQFEGQVVWPAGQPMTPAPNHVFFQVKNPDGTRSGFVQTTPEIQYGVTPTPVLTEITPTRIVSGSKNAQVTLKGRNFTSGSKLLFLQTDTGEVTELSTHFVNTGELKITLPDKLTSQLQSWIVMVLNGGLESKRAQLKIVPPGLPDAPELLTLEPFQLPSSLSPSDTWITLRGTNFVESDTIVIANALPGRMQTEFVSENEIRALVPKFWLRGPDYINVHVESAQDPDLASGKLTLEILNTVNIKLPSRKPIIGPIIRVVNNDGYLPQPPSGTTGNIPVSISGINFEPGSTVEAYIIGNRKHEFVPYEVSETALAFYIPAELIRARVFQATLLLTLVQASNTD